MNGAEALIQTLSDHEVNICFANPGTSEMPLLAAVDKVGGVHPVLCLFEGVATGAADGYGRMAERPAATLLHLGPGLGNGLANLHNARRARTPILNIVGDHASYHKQYDSPLESDIDSMAATVSSWVGRVSGPDSMGSATTNAISAACTRPLGVATLIVPADACWSDGGVAVAPTTGRLPPVVDEDSIRSVVKALRSGEPTAMLLSGRATRSDTLVTASRISAATGAKLFTATSTPRLERGAGVPRVERLLYRAESAAAQLSSFRHLILVDAPRPVAFFAYPGLPSDLVAGGCDVIELCSPADDAAVALGAVADVVAQGARATLASYERPALPTGSLTPDAVAAALGALMPEGAVVIDESNTAGLPAVSATAGAPPHDWLRLTGGSIGIGLPLALGAAMAAPTRKTIALQADGSALYTIQALWTMAREGANVVTVLLNNRSYAILRAELERTGATAGASACDMLDLSRPDIDFVRLAGGFGVDAATATTAEELVMALRHGLAHDGPYLVDAIL